MPRSALTLRATYAALRRALLVSLARASFRVVHLAVVRNRVELIVEADDKTALARGMQGFQVSAAKWLNRALGRRGTVFPDRYRMRVLRTRVDVRDIVGRLPFAAPNGAPHAAPNGAPHAAPNGAPHAAPHDAPVRPTAWPQTWLLRIELARLARADTLGYARKPP